MSAYAERQARGRRLCELLAERVQAKVSPGIGKWEPAWQIVAEVSADFLAALAAWEAIGGEEARDLVKATYEAVLCTWDEAERLYQEHQEQGAHQEHGRGG